MTVDQSTFIHQAIKLVVPMRREFGRSVRVENMLNDPAYAQAVLELALTSDNERLRELALYVQRMLPGPRGGALESPASSGPSAAQATLAEPSVDTDMAALEALKSEKYRRGLR
jgi:hypothetical protein